MSLEIQFKLKNNPSYQEYIRENSDWYKILNRNPNYFKQFEEKAKERYGRRPSDRIEKILNTVEMIGNVVSTLSS